ncbi:hypothetical protein C8R44DRAFT_871755 [Mycena epipterygia]|nr:hypothetical protein C8R44DRAFT_871755 [Mycena epipterygia]
MDDSPMAPTLSPELERPIFELAALSRPKEIPTLMRVSWRVKLWVEPLLYRTLLIRGTSHLTVTDCFPSCGVDTFMQIASTEKASFLRDSVRNLMVDFLSTESTHAVLSACKSVENLHVIIAAGLSLQSALPPLDMPLRHLYCDLQDFCEMSSFEPFCHSSFHKITHLELFAGFEGLWSRLVDLPQLTHLALGTTGDIPVCEQVLATLKSLRALVILHHPPPARLSVELAILSEDPRFVMMGLDYHIEDWQTGILTGDDYWARADEFIAKRISGEIERESPVRRKFFLGEKDEEA